MEFKIIIYMRDLIEIIPLFSTQAKTSILGIDVFFYFLYINTGGTQGMKGKLKVSDKLTLFPADIQFRKEHPEVRLLLSCCTSAKGPTSPMAALEFKVNFSNN